MSTLETLGPSKEVFTLGELFPDGSAIERLRQNLLVLWSEGKAQIQPAVEYGGHVYTAAKLDPQLEEALRLPSKTEDFGSIEDLIAEVLSMRNPVHDCCVEALSSSPHEFQVHQVHEVHGTQEPEESVERK